MIAEDLRRFLSQRQGAQAVLLRQQKTCEAEQIRLEQKINDLLLGKRITQEALTMTQKFFKEYLESLGTSVLQAVFPDKRYKFLVEFDQKENKTDIELLVQQGEKEPYTPKDEQGGALMNVLDFALRAALWSLAEPQSRPTMVFDEPFRFTGALVKVAGEMMRWVSKELGVQIIMVTHSEELMELADKSWRVTRKGEEASQVIQVYPIITVPVVERPQLKRRTKI